MWSEKKHFRLIGLYLAFAMFLIGAIPADVLAGWSPSAALQPAGVSARAADLESVRQVIESKAVTARLLELGYTAEEVQARVDRLDDSTLHSLATNLDSLQTGGDGLGFIIGVLVIVILVIVIIQLTGHKVIVK